MTAAKPGPRNSNSRQQLQKNVGMSKGARIVPEQILEPPTTAGSFKRRLEVMHIASSSSAQSMGSLSKPVGLGKLRADRALKGSSSSVQHERSTSRQRKWMRRKEKILNFLDSRPVSVLMACVTLYALFGDDTRIFSAPVSADNIFYNLSFTALMLYTLEFILHCIAKPQYVGSFYFWLDLVSTCSLVVDVGWYVHAHALRLVRCPLDLLHYALTLQDLERHRRFRWLELVRLGSSCGAGIPRGHQGRTHRAHRSPHSPHPNHEVLHPN